MEARFPEKCTPDRGCCEFELTYMVNFMIQDGDDIDGYGDDGSTALHNAAEPGNIAIVQLLLEHGANIEAQEDEGSTALLYAALLYAALHGETAVLKLLLEHGVAANSFDKHENSILRRASEESDVRLLLSHGADIECSADRAPSLSWAARNGPTAVVQLLLEHGAGANALDQHEDSALALVMKNGNGADVVLLLLKHGGDIEEKLNGTPILCVAADRGLKQLHNFCLSMGLILNIEVAGGRHSVTQSMQAK